MRTEVPMFRSLRTQQRAYASLSATYFSNPVLTNQAYRVDLSRSCINVNVPPMSATQTVRPGVTGRHIPLYTDGTTRAP